MRTCRPLHRRSLLPLLLALACAAGCSGTTPEGPLGRPIDLRPYLPPGVSPPPEAQTTLHRARVEVGDPPALVDLEWRTFQQGGKACVLSAAATVQRAGDGVQLSAMAFESSEFPTPPDGPEGTTQSVRLKIEWERKTLTRGSYSWKPIEINGDGSWR